MRSCATPRPRPRRSGPRPRGGTGSTGVAASDGTDRGLTIGGDPAAVAAFLDGYARIGVSEVIVVFRDPVDLETIERVGELRTALGAIAASA